MDDPSIRQLFEARNRNRKREQGGVATLTAMRRTEDGRRKPSHAFVTWQADVLDMSTREGESSHALLAVDVGTRKVWGELMRGRSSEEAAAALRRMREGLGHVPKVLSTDRDTAFMGGPFQEYLRRHKIDHVTKEKFGDSQLGLVDAKMRVIKQMMFREMAADADARGGDEPDWGPFFLRAVRAQNRKPLNYLMGQSVAQTFGEDGRPRDSGDPAVEEKRVRIHANPA